MLDNRLLPYIAIHVTTECIFDRNNEPLKNYRMITVTDLRNRLKVTENKFVMNISHWFKYYDTNEIVKPLYRGKKDVKKV
jgi:hypothetical protein